MASSSSLLLCASLLIVAALACRTTQGGWVPTEEEDAELEAQLKQLNKPAVKTIQSVINGELFDCVDFYKQPAFDNPLLKNHKLQLRASGGFAKKLLKSSSSRGKLEAAHWGYNDSCPIGTVLIRRTTKEELIASKTILRRLPSIDGTKEDSRSKDFHTALLYARNNAFTGFRAALTTWEIPEVKGVQYSASAAWILGPTSSGNGIGAGWHVYPKMYKDNRPRFFTIWTRDEYRSTVCFNLRCSGFVQYSNIFAPGGLVPEVSSSSAGEKNITIVLYKSVQGQYWWVEAAHEFIGYWPLALFKDLKVGKKIEFGGQVFAPPNLDLESPPMGNGKFPGHGSAYFRNVYFADEQSRGFATPDNKDLNFDVDLPDHYKIWRDSAMDANFNVAYGGPGGYKPS